MIDPTTVLTLGFLMVGLTYYVGAILAGMPTYKGRLPPIRLEDEEVSEGEELISVAKLSITAKLGFAMMKDAATASFVLVIFTMPMTFVRLVGMMGWGDADIMYTSFFSWLGIERGIPTGSGLFENLLGGLWYIVGIIVLLILINVLLTVVFAILSAILGDLGLLVTIFGGIITGIFQIYIMYQTLLFVPILVMIPLTGYFLYATYFFAEFIRRYWVAIMAFGALIYAIPARVGRNWGAAMIAISLVFYVGLPLMPYWVEPFASTETAKSVLSEVKSNYQSLEQYHSTMNQSSVYFQVRTEGMSEGYYRLHMAGGGKSWVTWTDSSGQRLYTLPRGEYEVSKVDFRGVPLNPKQPVSFSTEQSSLQGSNLIQVQVPLNIYKFNVSKDGVESYAFLDFDGCQNLRGWDIKPTGGSIEATVWASEDSYTISFFISTGTQAELLIDGVGVNTRPTYSSSLGTLFESTNYGKGSHKVSMRVLGVAQPPSEQHEDVNPVQEQYAYGGEPPKDLDYLTYYFVGTLVFPAIYIWMILMGVSVGVAKVIAGRDW